MPLPHRHAASQQGQGTEAERRPKALCASSEPRDREQEQNASSGRPLPCLCCLHREGASQGLSAVPLPAVSGPGCKLQLLHQVPHVHVIKCL